MTRAFTAAEIARVMRTARAVDPLAVVELVTAKGTIRILPHESVQAAPSGANSCDGLFGAGT